MQILEIHKSVKRGNGNILMIMPPNHEARAGIMEGTTHLLQRGASEKRSS
jgi:hypothetical protein